MPDATREHGASERHPLVLAIGVVGAVFPLLVVAVLVAQQLLPEAEPDTLAGWVAELDAADPERKERAAAELLRRAEGDPEPVIEALVDSMRRAAAEAAGPAGPAGDVSLRLVATDGEGYETPALPIGIWIFGERTLVGDGERLELKVVPVEAWRAFAAAHAGRTVAFVAGGQVATRHRLAHDEADTLVLEPAGRRDGLAVVFGHHRFFHDGSTEAGKVLARLGGRVRPALEALAREGTSAAHRAAWAWWRLDRNEVEAAQGR